MEFEFKEYIRDEILSNINHMNILDDALDELDHVYEQAAKADEYEAKAKAFDEIMNLYINGSDKYLKTKRHTLDVFIEDVAEILNPFAEHYESGESE